MHTSLKPELLFNLGPLPITNSLLTSIISVLVLLIAGVAVGKNFKRLPSGMQHAFEMAYEMFENLAQEALGKDGLRFVPILLTLFLFIITSNWMGVLPGVGSITYTPAAAAHAEGEAKPAAEGEARAEAVPLFRGGNADLNTTFALALVAMVFIHATGIKSSGLGHHLAHFKNPLEIVSELGKILSFSFRLFGNVFAGEVLLGAMSSIIAIITNNFANAFFGVPGGLIAVPFYLFELFVGFIQAFVFAMLTLSFLSVFYKADHH